MLIFGTQNVYMSKFAREVEAVQFLPKEDENQFCELVIDGASTIVHAGDFIEYEKGVPVDVWSEGSFKAKHAEVLADEPKEEPKSKKK